MNVNPAGEIIDGASAYKGAEEPPMVLPAHTMLPADNEYSALGVVELLLKDPIGLDGLSREESRQTELIPRFLGIAVVSYTVFCLGMLVILNAAPADCYPQSILKMPAASWHDGSALGLLLAYNLGMIGATGICLPTFYFFSLLAGVRMSMLQLTGLMLRCQASGAIVLIGVLPIYVAVVLGFIVFDAPGDWMEQGMYFGLMLPFLAGIECIRCIYRCVMGMAETMPPERRCRRECFLRRLTVSWALVYTAVSPVMIFRLWQFFSDRLA